MSEDPVGFLVLLGSTAGAAVLWHALVKSYLLASVGAALSAVVAFGVLNFVRQGHLDMFFPLFIMLLVPRCFAFSLIIGLPFLLHRTRQERNRLRNGRGKQEASSCAPEVDRRWLWAFRIAAVVCFALATRVLLFSVQLGGVEDSFLRFLFLLPYAVILWGLRRHPNRAALSLAGAMGWGMGLIYAVIGVLIYVVIGVLPGSVLVTAHVALAATAMKVRQAKPPRIETSPTA